MKKLMFLAVVALMLAPFAQAQDDEYNHGQFDAFFNYMRIDPISENQFGVGGRIGFAVNPHVQLEGEVAYDFRHNHSDTFTDAFGTTSTVQTGLRTLTFLAGPKFQTTGPVRVFAVLKGGILNFAISNKNAPAGFVGQVGTVVDGDTKGAFYPGAGIEAFAGWFGIRGEIGDEMYFANGAHHNLRFTIGPSIRW